MVYGIVQVRQMLDNVSLAGQVVLREGDQHVPRRLDLAVGTEEARVVPDNSGLLGLVQQVNNLEKLFQGKLVERILVAVTIRMGHSGVRVLLN